MDCSKLYMKIVLFHYKQYNNNCWILMYLVSKKE